MIPYLIIHPDPTNRLEEVKKKLLEKHLKYPHPNLLWFEIGEKLGIDQARKISDHLSLKPYQDSLVAVVIIEAEKLTEEAQNALLKTLEEPLTDSLIILGVGSEEQLLPTITSRCQVTNIWQNQNQKNKNFDKEIEQLFQASFGERFAFIEKLKERENFLPAMVSYFREKLIQENDQKTTQDFLKDLVQAEKWASQNVNIRAILEYLMLKMP